MFRPFETATPWRVATPPLSARARALLTDIEADWRMVSGMDRVPQESTVDPARLHEALPYCFILGKTAAQSLRVRVAGQKLHDALRLDPRGMRFCGFFAEPVRPTVQALLDSVMDTPAILELPLVVHRGFARRAVSASLLAMPLRDPAGEITRVMGAIVPSDPLQGQAVEFDIATDRTIRHDPLETGLVDRRTSPNRVGQPVPRRGALRLVVDNS